jgi:hypothetical protein
MSASDAAGILLAFASPADITKAGATVKILAELELEEPVFVEGWDGHDVLNLDEERDRTGLWHGQPLGKSLEVLIRRYSLEGHPLVQESVRPSQGGAAKRASIFGDPGPRRTDPAPCQVTLSVTKNEYGWSAELKVAERGGHRLLMRFSPNGGAWPPTRREDNPGRSHTITLPPAIAHQAVLCIRNEKPAQVVLEQVQR